MTTWAEQLESVLSHKLGIDDGLAIAEQCAAIADQALLAVPETETFSTFSRREIIHVLTGTAGNDVTERFRSMGRVADMVEEVEDQEIPLDHQRLV